MSFKSPYYRSTNVGMCASCKVKDKTFMIQWFSPSVIVTSDDTTDTDIYTSILYTTIRITHTLSCHNNVLIHFNTHLSLSLAVSLQLMEHSSFKLTESRYKTVKWWPLSICIKGPNDTRACAEIQFPVSDPIAADCITWPPVQDLLRHTVHTILCHL